MAPLSFRELLPDPGETAVRPLLESLPLVDADPAAHRPYVVVNFVASVDGHVRVDGRSGALGDDGDKDLFRALRERSDAVLAGTNTMAIERYGRMLVQEEARARRVAAGRAPEPLACIVTRSGSVPLGIPLFAEPEARVVVFSPVAPALDGIAADVRYEPLLPGDPPLTRALDALRADYGVQTLLCEGGPQLFLGLLREGLVDELFLTLAPKLLGPAGDGTLIGAGPPLPGLAGLRLLTVLERDGSLFLRYALGAGGQT